MPTKIVALKAQVMEVIASAFAGQSVAILTPEQLGLYITAIISATVGGLVVGSPKVMGAWADVRRIKAQSDADIARINAQSVADQQKIGTENQVKTNTVNIAENTATLTATLAELERVKATLAQTVEEKERDKARFAAMNDIQNGNVLASQEEIADLKAKLKKVTGAVRQSSDNIKTVADQQNIPITPPVIPDPTDEHPILS